MENSDVQDYRILSMDINIISYIFNSQKNRSGERTIVYFTGERYQPHGERSRDPWRDTKKIVQDRVLGEKRSAAFATSIWDIQNGPFGLGWWSDCKDCDSWYKSEHTVLSEARF